MSGLLARWHERSRRKQWLIAIGVLLVVFVGIGALSGGSKDAAPAVTEASAVEETIDDAEPVAAQTAPSVTGKIRGRFDTEGCFGCGDSAEYVEVDSTVWCGWHDGKVIVHVEMKNTSVEHLTVNWHPSYTIVGGSEHGAGLSAVQSDGFDAGEYRILEAEQKPEGTQPNAQIDRCKPSFYLVEVG